MADLGMLVRSSPLLRLADRCERADRQDAIACLREAYTLLYDDRMDGGAPQRVFDTLVKALAIREAAILLIPPNCVERLDWSRSEGPAPKDVLFEVTMDVLDGPKAISRCKSHYRALAYIGAAMRAHAYLQQQERHND